MKHRIHITIHGAVQGVGFRPFVYRLANELNIYGFVLNNSEGVIIEAENEKEILESFLLRLQKEKPSHSIIQSLETTHLDPVGYESFEIRESNHRSKPTVFILPDIAMCDECFRELFDPLNRRYLYPFINCTHCGPRYSIIESLPYDRPNTSMKNFKMCDQCKSEYIDPADRRFHAQPIACPACGPHVVLWDSKGNILSSHLEVIESAIDLIRKGKIIALKGLGGFQLILDAYNDDAVQRLRSKKHREEKPFALMFEDINSVKEICDVSPLEERLLTSSESPIVLLKKKTLIVHHQSSIVSSVAPHNPYLGVMLPYTPLHHILLRELHSPIVATSGNLSEEPMCIDEHDALKRLNGIADFFLVHNRPIVRHVDDSIVRIVLDREMILRRARGYAPLPIPIQNHGHNKTNKSDNILAVGVHLKNTIALKVNSNVFVSQHIGDIATNEAYTSFTQTIQDFQKLYSVSNEYIIHDLHPDYLSTQFAKHSNTKLIPVQHHHAHVAACYEENKLEGTALGVAWDGTGFGLDGTIWGGEFFLTDGISFNHAAQFKQFPLPGGERAIHETKRSALGLFYEMFGESFFQNESIPVLQQFESNELSILKSMLKNKINCPMTSSVGRLFDAIASIINIRQHSAFEGQAAMMLEWIADETVTTSYPFEIGETELFVINVKPVIESIIEDINRKANVSKISASFHNTLAEIILALSKKLQKEKIILSGGCFQNVFLLKRTVHLLEKNNFKPYWHQRVPTNDGGISFGQIVIGSASIAE